MRKRCRDCDGLVSTKSTDRCRKCHGLLMKRRHRLKRARTAQVCSHQAKLVMRLVKRMGTFTKESVHGA